MDSNKDATENLGSSRCSSSFRVIEYRRDNKTSGERFERYRIQERVRAWWKLFVGWTWVTLKYEAGLPGYFFPYEFGSRDEAVKKIEAIKTYRQWSRTRRTVIDVR